MGRLWNELAAGVRGLLAWRRGRSYSDWETYRRLRPADGSPRSKINVSITAWLVAAIPPAIGTYFNTADGWVFDAPGWDICFRTAYGLRRPVSLLANHTRAPFATIAFTAPPVISSETIGFAGRAVAFPRVACPMFSCSIVVAAPPPSAAALSAATFNR